MDYEGDPDEYDSKQFDTDEDDGQGEKEENEEDFE